MNETTNTTTTENAAPAEVLKWERETCSRCGGSGNYSYCQMYGTRCFKCAGRKVVLTKRGAMASLWFSKVTTIPAREIKIGDWVEVMGCTLGGQVYTQKAQVTATYQETPENNHGYGIHTVDGVEVRTYCYRIETIKGSIGTTADSGVRKYFNRETTNALLRLSIEYQNALTKAGKVPAKLAKAGFVEGLDAKAAEIVAAASKPATPTAETPAAATLGQACGLMF